MKFQCQLCSCAIHEVKPWMLGKRIVCPNCSRNVAMPSSPFGVGRIIGDFIIEEKIGEGSIGTVYLAHQASLDRKVALKLLSEQYANAKGMSSFLSEARAAAKLSHPNLVKCLAVNEESGICYMAMNYIKGQTLKQKIKTGGKINVDEALHIAQQVAEALHCAWEEARLIHRDVKPENIMIDEDGVVQLTDLGLAMPQTEWHEGMEISGSPSYMSPEQFTGEKLDTRSDIYSLGVSLYQMLSGKLPFMGKTLNSVARQHFKEIATPLNKLVPTIPRQVSDLVSRMMAKRPDDRFKDMDDLLNSIWKIRQSTAPEKELVPSVHTVTMKKLDYDLQLQSKARKIQIQMAENVERGKSDTLVRIIAVAVPIVVLAVILIIAMSTQSKNRSTAGMKMVEDIEAMLEDDDASMVAVDAEIEKARKSLLSMPEKLDPSIGLRLELCAKKVETIKLQERNRVLETQASSLALRLHDLEVKTQDDNRMILDSGEKDRRIKQLETKIQALERDIKKERDLSAGLRRNINALNDRDFAAWCDDLRLKTSVMIRNGKFQEAHALLKISLENASKSQEKWISDKTIELQNVEKLFSNIENSAQRYAGLDLKEGKLKEIIGASAYIVTSLGVVESSPWKTLCLESLKALTPPDIVNSAGEMLPYYFALLNGRFSDTAEFLGKNPEAKSTMLAVRNYIFENIRYTAATDRKKASARAEDFLKDFNATEGMDKIKADLNAILKEQAPL